MDLTGINSDDLARVLRRAGDLWEPDVAQTWMVSPNAYLGGATPIGVLATRGPDEVLAALDQAIAGGYA